MYLYYTIVSTDETEQVKPNLSLGGFKSSSKVQNGVINNMFSDITNLSVSNYNQNRYIGLVLKNETGGDIVDVKAWFDYQVEKYANMKISAINMILDSNGSYQMEHVDTVNSKPLYSEFFEADGVANAVELGVLANNEQIGIWVEMELLIDAIKAATEDVYKVDPENSYRYLEVVKEKIEEVLLKFSWT